MITPFELANGIAKELIKANERIKELEIEVTRLNDALGGCIIALVSSVFSKDEIEKLLTGPTKEEE